MAGNQPKAAVLQRILRIFEGTLLLFGALMFLTFGVVAISKGAMLLGGGFTLIGTMAVAGSALYLWRGAHLGVKIVGKDLIIESYFSKSSVPLVEIRRFYRSVDATVIETSNGNRTIDDCYFADPQMRDSLFQALRERVATEAGP